MVRGRRWGGEWGSSAAVERSRQGNWRPGLGDKFLLSPNGGHTSSELGILG